MDAWEFPAVAFAQYCDDIVVHSRSEAKRAPGAASDRGADFTTTERDNPDIRPFSQELLTSP